MRVCACALRCETNESERVDTLVDAPPEDEPTKKKSHKDKKKKGNAPVRNGFAELVPMYLILTVDELYDKKNKEEDRNCLNSCIRK